MLQAISDTSSDVVVLLSPERELICGNRPFFALQHQEWDTDSINRVMFHCSEFHWALSAALSDPESGAHKNTALLLRNPSETQLRSASIRYLGTLNETGVYVVQIKTETPRKLNAGYAKDAYSLTKAEIECVRLILEGVTETAALAKSRNVSVNTVKKQVASILQKVEAQDKTALAAKLASDPNLFL